MIISKETQEAWLSAYQKERHTIEECCGFIDGINKALEVVQGGLSEKETANSCWFIESAKESKQ